MLAAKTALTIRYDALGENTSAEMGAENRLKVETRLRLLEERGVSLAESCMKLMFLVMVWFFDALLSESFPFTQLCLLVWLLFCGFSQPWLEQ